MASRSDVLQALLVMAVVACSMGSSEKVASESSNVGVGVTIPGSSSLESPSSPIRVESREADGQGSHALLLRRKGDDSPRVIYEYGRSVQVDWSSDSNWLLITDHRESDESTCVILRVSDGQRFDALAAFKREAERYRWLRNHHVYISCSGSLDGGGALVVVTGYGDSDPNGFRLRYRLKIRSNDLTIEQE